MSVIARSMLLDSLDEEFDKKSSHGPNLRGAIRGLTAMQAAWRPAGGPAPAEAAWKRDIAILEAEHRKLRDTLATLPARAFNPAMCHLIRCAAAHDRYHAGQIRLLRRMRS
jgi:hypothetical protein